MLPRLAVTHEIKRTFLVQGVQYVSSLLFIAKSVLNETKYAEVGSLPRGEAWSDNLAAFHFFKANKILFFEWNHESFLLD